MKMPLFTIKENDCWIQFSSIRLPKIKMVMCDAWEGVAGRSLSYILTGNLDLGSLLRRVTPIQT